MLKKNIRENTLTNLNRLANQADLKQQQEAALHQQLFTSDLWQNSQTIGVTLSTRIELDTKPIIQQAWAEGKTVAVPKVLPQKEMGFIKINSGTLYEESSFGIKEPQNNDIINKNELELLIVPGVAFRLDGYRVGFGGGYYDRYLVAYTGKTCSLVLPTQLGLDWQEDAYDLPVDRLFIL